MKTREELIEEAAKAILAVEGTLGTGRAKLFARAAFAAFAVFEKARTPTDDEREADEKAILNALYDSREAFTGVGAEVGTDETAILVDHVPDIVLALGFRRSEVPEPQGEPSDAPKRLVHEVNMLLGSVASHGPAALTDTSDRMYTAGLLRRLRDALDPRPAQRLAAGNAVRAEMARNGLDVHRMVRGQEIANVLAGEALDAALRAAGGVR